MRRIISTGFTALLSSLVQIDNGAAMMNGLLHLNDHEEIQGVSVVGYLGLHIESRLAYKKHIDYLADKFWGRIHLAISVTGRRSHLSLENKVILYIKFCAQ
ncbi:hypothetical protein TNCV_3408561 [Trichonephila clavipes]|nr:hypothetical protein TNCV_3408561 [Trichonephila clavipes]